MTKKRTRKKSTRKRRGSIVVLFLLLALGLVAYVAVKIFGPNTGSFTEGEYLHIRTGAVYSEVKAQLVKGHFIKDERSFDLLAKRAGYPEKVRAGRYHLEPGMSNYEIIRKLRSGMQTPVRMVIGKLRTKEQLIQKLSSELEADPRALRQQFSDPVYLAQFGLDTHSVLAAVIPDTYEFFWNSSADQAYRRLAKHYKQYWDSSRVAKAEALGLRPRELVTLASIVEEETNQNEEKGRIASVYLNRLRLGMPLQADPTVRYAWGDFMIRRVTRKHLQYPSPYNTYLNPGLPPGPICTPSRKTLEAVLNAPNTDYFYFCAREDFSGFHRFARTYREHQKNARLYQKALNQRGIR